VPFRHKYLKALLDMHESQNYLEVSEINMKTLPKIGYICLLEGHPVAAGFLRRVEGGYAQIDTLVSNAHFGGLIRHEGIKKVVDALIEDAKALRLRGIVSFTGDSGVLKRAEALGFHVVNQQLIALRL